ncbi:AMP-binding protein, partial [Micromonospora rosaria]
MDELSEALARRAELIDAAVVERTGGDGVPRRVAYVVPAPTSTTAEARRAAGAAVAAAGDPGTPVLVAVVSGIPRDADGAPDEAALRAVPVAATAGGALVRVPDREPTRTHLADLLDLPPRWGSDLAAPPAGPATGDTPAAPQVDGVPAEAVGVAPVADADDPTTLPEALRRAARRWPERGLDLVEADGTRTLSYPHLLDTALRALAGLRAAGLATGDPVILHLPSLADHFVALWACLLGGLRPVAVAQAPGYQARNATLDKLEHAWQSLHRPVVVSSGAVPAKLRAYAEGAGWAGLRVVDLADCRAHEPAGDLPRPAPDDVAMLQLSSGSTSKSKVIPLTHRGIVRYAQDACQVARVRPGDVMLNWLPLDHVAGLVMMHLGPVVLGCANVHVGTALVLADPPLWLDLLQRYRVQHSWSPNFGYKLVTEAVRSRPDRRWDLSGLRTLVNAGEQCTEPVMSGFRAALADSGLDPSALVLAWGMAETCTAISYQTFGPDAVQHARLHADGSQVRLAPASVPGTTTFLSMGGPAPGTRFRIAAPDGRTALPERWIGRLQVRSDRVTPGYLNHDEANRAAFPDGEWFDTGDLAYLHDGRITITGRGKEVIIVNGVHYFCHEIEDVVGAVDGVAPSFVAAFGAPGRDGTERIVVVFCADAAVDVALLTRVRRTLAERLQIGSAHLVPVVRDQFEKTTSGKIQRTSMRTRLLAGGYEAALRRVDLLDGGPTTVTDCVYRPTWTPRRFPQEPPRGPVLVVADGSGLAARLRRDLPDADVVELTARPPDDASGPAGGATGPAGGASGPAGG